MVHKLCYLPENRANLVWNSEVQIRLIMLMFSDIINGEEFREKRVVMKEYDSKRRHINVSLNNAKRELDAKLTNSGDKKIVEASLPLTVVQPVLVEVPPTLTVVQPVLQDDRKDYTLIAEHLNSIARQRTEKQRELREIKRTLSSLTIDIEAMQEKLEKEEEAFILNQINKLESEEVKIALHKLLHRNQCPACGSESEELSTKAHQYAKEGRCPLCGSDDKIGDAHQLPLLDAELSEKLKVRLSIEEQLIRLEQEIEQVQSEESSIQLEYDEYIIGAFDDKIKAIENTKELGEITTVPQDSLEDKVRKLQKDYTDADMRFNQLKRELDEKYMTFNRLCRERVDTLAQLYQEYSTAFLGIPCELEPHKANIEFLDINLYVPKFDGQIRPNPESCSEAQRFFLDIAFRMAMIDLCYKLGDYHGTFICETPENALDVSYVDNVAEMFKSFSRRGHVFLATSNLQPGALAAPMLSDYKLGEKKASLLNLLEYGTLSKVQQDHLPLLQEQLANILQEGT